MPASRQLLVGEAPGQDEAEAGKPFVGGSGAFLNNLLAKAGIDRNKITIANSICCRPPNNVYPTDFKWHHTSRADARAGVAYCQEHFLKPLVQGQEWDKIIAVGDQALQAVTNRRGILVWRGSPLPTKWDNTQLKVIPTLHPAYLLRDMNMASVVVGDLRKKPQAVPEHYNLYATPNDLQNFSAPVVAFDFEWDRYENITICGISGRFYEAITGSWSGNNINEFRRIFESATDLVGHNIIGADTKYFTRMGWQIGARMHDTMLKQHLLQPSMKHGLGFVGSVFTNKMFWKGKGHEQEDADGNIVETKYQWRTWNTPDAIPRELGGYGGCTSDDEAFRLYNARDTDGSFQINTHLDTLLRKWNLEHVYWNVAVPISYICRDISDAGIRIDTGRLKAVRVELKQEIDELETTLPDGLAPIIMQVIRQVPAPVGTYRPKNIKCKGTKKAGTSHTPVTITVYNPGTIPQCHECGTVLRSPKLTLVKKIKVPGTELIRPYNSSPKVMAYARSVGLKIPVNRKRGTEAADVNARKGWGRTHAEFRILDKIKKLGTELNTFAKEEMENVDRLFFRLNPTGTSEGRFSSSGQRQGLDPNIQNQPPSIRKIYIPDRADYSFVELDYSSGENFLTAYLAGDNARLGRLRTPGYSEHLDLARQLFDCPDLTKSKEDVREFWGQKLTGFQCYDIGKHANHGGNYGMTHVKLQEYMEGNGIFFSTKQCKDVIATRKAMNPETARWQDETIERAKRDGYLRNVFGRIRWFSTRDIATKALAFLPASTLADIIIRAMIAHYPTRFQQEIINLGLTKVGELCDNTSISAQIHDSLLIQGPTGTILEQASRSKTLMEQPWAELQGFNLSVEVKLGGPNVSWGELKGVQL